MKPLYVKKNGVVYRVSGTGIPSIYPAENVEYDNTVTSELQATDVQSAIDELSTREAGVQSDWNEDDSAELDYIKNKPQNLVQDASYVHTDNNYDATAKGKVDALGTASTKDAGVANGVAELDAAGKVPSSQLPSFVDDVIEVADYDHLPITGESGKIYVTLDTNKTYRWTGSGYAEISESLALGETSSTAYRGDRGKTAYDHATETKLSTATTSGLYKVAATAQGHIASLTAVEKSDITALGIPAQDTTYVTTSNVTNGSTALVTSGGVYNQAPRFKDLGSRADYKRIVIGLCEISASASQGSGNFFSGQVITIRTNGLFNTKMAEIVVQDSYSVAKSCAYSLLTNFENTSTTAATGEGYRACVFTYGSKNYAGLEFYISSSTYTCVMGTWTASFTPFAVIYYTQNTSTVENAEINGSINFTTTNNIRYGLTVDNAINANKVNNLTVQTAVPANAVFTDTKNTTGSTNSTSKLFLVGATEQSANPQTYSNTNVFATNGTLTASNAQAVLIGINSNTGTTGGISLYNGTGNSDNYGIMFRKVSNKGTHGYMQDTNNWATYFTMYLDGTASRGWIFNNKNVGNVASINTAGNAVFNGSVTIGGNASNTSGARMEYNSTTQSIDFIFN